MLVTAKLRELPLLAVLGLACATESAPQQPDDGSAAGMSANAGSATGGSNSSAGTSAMGGRAGTASSAGAAGTATAGANAGTSAGTGASGAAGSAGNAGGSGGGAAGTGAGGGSSGGGSVAGSGGSGGLPAGGASGFAGATSGAGGAGGSGGSPGPSDAAAALDGLRVDDPCTGTASREEGAVCNHVMLTNAGGFQSEKRVTIAGTPGETYDVTLRIRGVVEPTIIQGGMRDDTSTFQYKDLAWRKVPFTAGGSVASADYAQWHIHVAEPEQEFYLNDYQRSGHYIFELDYEVTIPIAANSEVTLAATDSNERLIVNYEDYAPDGIPGAMNYGQFVQINVVAAVARAD